jgi:hypothetical protein
MGAVTPRPTTPSDERTERLRAVARAVMANVVEPYDHDLWHMGVSKAMADLKVGDVP